MDVHPPMAALRRGERTALLGAGAILTALIAVAAGYAAVGEGGSALERVVRDYASSAAYVLAALVVGLRALRVRESRGPWTLLAAGLTLYTAGNLLWSLWLQQLPEPPIPSLSDALWLSLYPFSYVALVGLGRPRGAGVPAGVWLDGIIAGLGIAALGAAVVFTPVLESASGSAVAVATNLAYPIADLLLAALVMGVLALRSWRPGRMWLLLGSGFLMLALADCLYLLRVASGVTDASTLANVPYLLGVAIIAAAAWAPARPMERPRLEDWSVLVVPGTFTITALTLLTIDHFTRIDTLAVTLALLTVGAALVRTVLTFRDVRALAETRREALTDDLTSLPNRRMFLRHVDRALADGQALALLLIDLDHFKELNDALGHQAGDRLLRQIGPRLREALPEQYLVARLGGDEFGVLVPGAGDDATALRAADALLAAIADPFDFRGLRLHVGASIGVARFPEHGADSDELLQHADIAMYAAKSARTGREVYSAERDRRSRTQLALMDDLRSALETGALAVHFQPKALAADGAIVGAEALVRWNHPERGFVPPAEFVGLAERAGLSRSLTARVLDLALEQGHVWRSEGRDLHVAVNVTVEDLLDTRFPDEVAEALRRDDLDPEALVIEITETSVLSDPVRIGSVLSRLSAQGVGLSLDDFGTGFSSLTHLRVLPVGEVKIDRSFVRSMACDQADAAIVRSTVQLAHSLGLRVVAEGVEDDRTWAALARIGCNLVQGYRIARPMPADRLAEVLDSHHLRAGSLHL